jgi:hypothetical protein
LTLFVFSFNNLSLLPLGKGEPEMHRVFFLRLCLAAAAVFCVLQPAVSPCVAQDFPGLANPFSPLFSFPPLQAEAKGSLIWMRLLNGKEVAGNQSFDFRNFWGMDAGALFVDSTVRLQVGPFSARLEYAMRYFKGDRGFTGTRAGDGVAAFDYTGLRLGGDFDVVRWNGSRVGIDMDYDLYHPQLSVTSVLPPQQNVPATGAIQLTGPTALTLGFHVIYNPSHNLYGLSPAAEGKARWSISGSDVTDWEVAGGLKSPETVIGTMAIRSGYRHTSISFRDWGIAPVSTPPTGPTVRAQVDVTMGGWFGELAYYY